MKKLRLLRFLMFVALVGMTSCNSAIKNILSSVYGEKNVRQPMNEAEILSMDITHINDDTIEFHYNITIDNGTFL